MNFLVKGLRKMQKQVQVYLRMGLVPEIVLVTIVDTLLIITNVIAKPSH